METTTHSLRYPNVQYIFQSIHLRNSSPTSTTIAVQRFSRAQHHLVRKGKGAIRVCAQEPAQRRHSHGVDASWRPKTR
jgi:hypothetical protein